MVAWPTEPALRFCRFGATVASSRFNCEAIACFDTRDGAADRFREG